MTADDMMQLVYLSIWGAVLVGYFLVAPHDQSGDHLAPCGAVGVDLCGCLPQAMGCGRT